MAMTVNGKSFKYYMTQSTVLHVLLVLIALVSTKIALLNKDKIRKTNIKLIEASVKVDMVAMPKFTIKELKSMDLGSEGEPEPEPIVKKVVQPDIKGPEFLKKKKKKSFLDMMKNLSAKKVSKSKKKPKAKKKTGNRGMSNTDRSALNKLVLSGNKLSKGIALTGGANAAAQEGFNLYVSKLPNFVRPNWKLPAYLRDKKDLRCRIRIYLAASGKVLRAEIYESSGNDDFDKRALSTVQKSSPFPSLDSSYSNKGIKGDILLGFPL